MSEQPQSRIRSLRAELTALGLLVPLAVILWLVIARWPTSPTPASAVPTAAPAQQATETPKTQTPTASPSPKASPQETVTLTIAGPTGTQNFGVTISAETTVAELLRQASDEHGFQLDTKDYGGTLGLFVEGLNGVRNDPATQKYWHLYVNGKISPLGASSARVRPGDTVRWAYEPMHEEE